MTQHDPSRTKSIHFHARRTSAERSLRSPQGGRQLDELLQAGEPVPTIVVGEDDIYRQGIVATLSTSRFKILRTVALDQIASDDAMNDRLFVVIAPQDDWKARGLVSELSTKHPALAIAFISDDFHIVTDGNKAIGFLPRTISRPALLLALELILCKEVYIGNINVNLNRAVDPPILPDEVSVDQSRMRFSGRERQILNLLAEGQSNKFIARRLSIEEATVKSHVRSVLRKSGVSNRTQAAVKARLLLLEEVGSYN